MTPTHFTPGRLRRLVSSSLLTLPLLLAACATPGGFSPPSSAPEATRPVATVRGDSTTTAALAVTPTAQASGNAAMAPVPVLVPVDPLRPDVRLNLDDRSAQTDLWARVRQGFAMPDLDNELVHNREQWYAPAPTTCSA